MDKIEDYFQYCDIIIYRMFKVCEMFGRQPFPRKIAFVFIINTLTVTVLIAISLVIQSHNIKLSQEQIPNKFFKSYNQYSIEQVAMKTKSLILAFIDYRLSYITRIRNLILLSSVPAYSNLNQTQMQRYYAKEPNKLSCQILNPSSTIFSCKMDLYSKFLIDESWPYHSKKPARRFNIIYQNLQDQNDIMAKSISENLDFSIPNVQSVNRRFLSLKNSSVFYISSFYQDEYGSSLQKLVSFSTQIIFPGYRVLLEVQTFGSFIKQSITKVTYSDDTNVVVLALNDTVIEKYNIVAFFKPLQKSINYTSLLKKGHGTSYLSDNQVIYSYTQPFSSSYPLNSLNYVNEQMLNQNFVLIVHSPRITKTMEGTIYGFISALYSSVIQIMIVLFFVLMIWMVINIMLLSSKLVQILATIKETIVKYIKNPDKYVDILNEVTKNNTSDYLVGFILKAIINIINLIEHNKRKFKKMSKKTDNDHYPLNLFHTKFMERQGILDQQRFQKIRGRLIQANKISMNQRQRSRE